MCHTDTTINITRSPTQCASVSDAASRLCGAVLQGSNDGEAWKTLRSHVDELTVKMPGQYASWPVTGHGALFSYQMFRLVLTGPNSSEHNNLCLSYVEFYGYLLCS